MQIQKVTMLTSPDSSYRKSPVLTCSVFIKSEQMSALLAFRLKSVLSDSLYFVVQVIFLHTAVSSNVAPPPNLCSLEFS